MIPSLLAPTQENFACPRIDGGRCPTATSAERPTVEVGGRLLQELRSVRSMDLKILLSCST